MARTESPSFPHLPDRINRLGELAYNLWWSWHADARSLYRTLDRTVWRETRHNPVRIVAEVSPERLEAAANDADFQQLYDRVMTRFDEYMGSAAVPAATSESTSGSTSPLIAYLCAEFGLHNSLPIYSGGLGILAGDTCKEASDLGLPFVAIGALYPEGYFTQKMDPDGSQQAIYERLDTDSTPLLRVLDDDGTSLKVAVPFSPFAWRPRNPLQPRLTGKRRQYYRPQDRHWHRHRGQRAVGP